MFFRIIDQLAEMNYTGSVARYSNNEPLIDKRLERFAEYTRDKLPNAILYLDTNGTFLSRERFRRLMEFLDYMTIDNYQDDMKSIPTVQELLPEIESPAYQDKVYICLRKQNEMLNNCGGLSGNRTSNTCKIVSGCVFPFDQMVVRPDGKISLCCNDATGALTLGDLTLLPFRKFGEDNHFKRYAIRWLTEGKRLRNAVTVTRWCHMYSPQRL